VYGNRSLKNIAFVKVIFCRMLNSNMVTARSFACSFQFDSDN
jgi:hypothetical protein